MQNVGLKKWFFADPFFMFDRKVEQDVEEKTYSKEKQEMVICCPLGELQYCLWRNLRLLLASRMLTLSEAQEL